MKCLENLIVSTTVATTNHSENYSNGRNVVNSKLFLPFKLLYSYYWKWIGGIRRFLKSFPVDFCYWCAMSIEINWSEMVYNLFAVLIADQLLNRTNHTPKTNSKRVCTQRAYKTSEDALNNFVWLCYNDTDICQISSWIL